MATTRSRTARNRVMRHIEANEVSLVEYPATFRKFFVVKGKGFKMKDKMVEALVNLCGDDAPDDFEETLKSVTLPKKEGKALESSLRVLNEYQEEFPDEVQTAIGVMATAAGIGFTKSAGKEKTNKVRLSTEDRERLDDLATAVSDMQETTEKLKSALKSEKKKSNKHVSKKKRQESDDENTVSFTKEDLEDFVDGITAQTLQGVGLINKDDVKKSERENDDPFMVDEDEIEEDRDGDDDDRLYEDADEDDDEEYYDDDDD